MTVKNLTPERAAQQVAYANSFVSTGGDIEAASEASGIPSCTALQNENVLLLISNTRRALAERARMHPEEILGRFLELSEDPSVIIKYRIQCLENAAKILGLFEHDRRLDVTVSTMSPQQQEARIREILEIAERRSQRVLTVSGDPKP